MHDPKYNNEDVHILTEAAVFDDDGHSDNITAEAFALRKALAWIWQHWQRERGHGILSQNVIPIFYDCSFPIEAMHGRVSFYGREEIIKGVLNESQRVL
eukprot:3345675-Karenia_brevis.AAC.1